jgi:hypothetical protein
MSETMTPEQQAALDDAKQQFIELQTQLAKATSHAKNMVQQHVLVARERLEHAERERSEAQELRERLEPRKAEPNVVEHYTKMAMLEELYTQMQGMMAIELAIHERNFNEIDAIPPLEMRLDYPVDLKPAVYAAHENIDYLEHRTRMDVASLDYHWYRNRRALDIVMRAAGSELRGYDASEEEEAQAAAAEDLKTQTAGERDLQILLGRLGPELEEAFALLDWAKESLQTLGQLPRESKREALGDLDYIKLNARLLLIMELPDRAKDLPALAELFPYKGPAELPFQHVYS